jgi:hypothetical protein
MKKHASWKHHENSDCGIGHDSLGVFAISSLALTILIGALLAGCTMISSNYRRSFDVSQQFENGEVVPGFRYYVSGPALKPIAIVAIREDYRLQSEHWRRIDLDNASLKALVERISYVLGAEYKEDQMIPNGARIISPDGAMVGMWYSVYDYSKVTFLDDKVIHISMAITRMPPGVRIPLD